MAHLAHYREAHPLPFVITHWVNLVCMLLLILSGLYIHFPFFPGWEGVARGLHMFCAFVIVINCLTRVVLAFVVKSAPTGGTREKVTDFKTWLPQADNRHQLGAWLKYYLFLKKEHPLGAKLGVPQKLTYLAIPPLLILMFFTGMCLWGPTMHVGPFVLATDFVGGLMVMRIIHFFMMFFFICFMLLHVYLANVEGLSPSKLMFFRREHGGLTYNPEKHVIDGEDDSVH